MQKGTLILPHVAGECGLLADLSVPVEQHSDWVAAGFTNVRQVALMSDDGILVVLKLCPHISPGIAMSLLSMCRLIGRAASESLASRGDTDKQIPQPVGEPDQQPAEKVALAEEAAPTEQHAEDAAEDSSEEAAPALPEEAAPAHNSATLPIPDVLNDVEIVDSLEWANRGRNSLQVVPNQRMERVLVTIWFKFGLQFGWWFTAAQCEALILECGQHLVDTHRSMMAEDCVPKVTKKLRCFQSNAKHHGSGAQMFRAPPSMDSSAAFKLTLPTKFAANYTSRSGNSLDKELFQFLKSRAEGRVLALERETKNLASTAENTKMTDVVNGVLLTPSLLGDMLGNSRAAQKQPNLALDSIQKAIDSVGVGAPSTVGGGLPPSKNAGKQAPAAKKAAAKKTPASKKAPARAKAPTRAKTPKVPMTDNMFSDSESSGESEQSSSESESSQSDSEEEDCSKMKKTSKLCSKSANPKSANDDISVADKMASDVIAADKGSYLLEHVRFFKRQGKTKRSALCQMSVVDLVNGVAPSDTMLAADLIPTDLVKLADVDEACTVSDWAKLNWFPNKVIHLILPHLIPISSYASCHPHLIPISSPSHPHL